MKIKASKTMTKELKKYLPEGYNMTLEKMSESQFAWHVDIDTYKHETDYNITDNTFSVIKVVYPHEFYAMPKYITTKDLNNIFKSCDKTWDGFVNSFLNEIAI